MPGHLRPTRPSLPRSQVPVMSKLVEMTSKDDVFTKYTGSCSYTIEGKGKMWYKDESVYEGEFQNGCKNGKGVLTFKNGKKCDGLFRDDKFIHGTISAKNADGEDYEYKGDVQNNLPHGSGFGKVIGKNGNRVTFKGKFENNFFVSGTYDDGVTKTVGYYKSGKIQGKGYIEKKDGRKWAGIWQDGFLYHGTYNGLQSEDENNEKKWGLMNIRIKSQIIKFSSEKRKFHKIEIISGSLKGKLCLMKMEWIYAYAGKEKSGDDNVDGYWKMNTIFHREDEFEEVLERISGRKVTKPQSVGAEKIESAVFEDSKKRKRDEDNIDDVWKSIFELAQQTSDK